jgi:hypothetical protein
MCNGVMPVSDGQWGFKFCLPIQVIHDYGLGVHKAFMGHTSETSKTATGHNGAVPLQWQLATAAWPRPYRRSRVSVTDTDSPRSARRVLNCHSYIETETEIMIDDLSLTEELPRLCLSRADGLACRSCGDKRPESARPRAGPPFHAGWRRAAAPGPVAAGGTDNRVTGTQRPG